MNFLSAGFTLIELLVVILIISILSTISFTIYQHYEGKAILTQYGTVFGKNCMNEIIDYCIENPNGVIDESVAPECNTSHQADKYTFNISKDNGQCSGAEPPDNYTVTITCDQIPDLKFVCTYRTATHGYTCTVELNQ